MRRNELLNSVFRALWRDADLLSKGPDSAKQVTGTWGVDQEKEGVLSLQRTRRNTLRFWGHLQPT